MPFFPDQSSRTMVATRSARAQRASSSEPKHAPRRSLKTTDSKQPKTPDPTSKSVDQNTTTAVKKKMNDLLAKLTSASSTICPSQIARGLNKDQPATYTDWRGMMDPVRDIVWEEVRTERVEVTQGGVVRSLEERQGLKGPIRVRRGPKWESG